MNRDACATIDEPRNGTPMRMGRDRRLPRLAERLRSGVSAAMFSTVAASLAVFGLNVLQGVVLARLLGPEGRGEFGAIVFYAQTLTYIGLLGTLFPLARRAGKLGADGARLENAATTASLLCGLTTLAFVALLSFLALPADKSFLAPLCIAYACVLPWEQWRLMRLSIDQGGGRFGRANVHQLAVAVVFPVLLGCAWWAGHASLSLVTALAMIPPFAGCALRIAADGRLPRFSPRDPAARVLLREGRPFFGAVLANDLLNRMDMLMMLWLGSLTAQGLYASAVPAGHLLTIAPNALAAFAFNAGARREAGSSRRQVALAALGVVLAQATCGLALALCLQPLMLLVYGPRFQAAVPLALAFLPAAALNGCVQAAEGYLRGRGKSGVGISSRVAAACVVAATAAALAPRFAELAIPLAASAGQATVATWMLISLLRDGWSPEVSA